MLSTLMDHRPPCIRREAAPSGHLAVLTDRAACSAIAVLLVLTAGCGSRPGDERAGEQETPEAAKPEPEPASAEPAKEPAPVPKRGRICLNGRWRFMPALGTDFGELSRAAAGEPAGEWGTIFVPGSWSFSDLPPVPIAVDEPGAGPQWEDFRGDDRRAWGGNTPRAWYEYAFRVPADWAGRHVEIEFRRVSTDAVVWVGGKECGRLSWPAGAVDVSEAVTPGEEANLRILVVATADPGEVAAYMEAAEGQVSKTGADLDARGIIGEVFLQSRPRGAHISDVFVKTSTREKTIALDVELTGIEAAGEVSLVAKMQDGEGNEEKEFSSSVQVEAGEVRLVGKILDGQGTEEEEFSSSVQVEVVGTQRVEVSWSWPDARLWDLGRPELYTLELHATGCGLDDLYAQRFGFREFRVEGKGFVLNERPIRLRPTLQGARGGNVREMDAGIDEAIEAGFTIQVLRPVDTHRRGTLCHIGLIAERADLRGWMLTGVAQSMDEFISRGWEKADVREEYERVSEAQLRRWRNHPSIVMWGTSGEAFGHGRDLDPRAIGRRGWADHERQWRRRADRGLEGIAVIKRLDPTRPVFTQGGAYVGDVHAVNCPFGMIPLQEREEWPSEWAASGEMPFMAIGLGGPTGGLTTEFRAAYLGREAFEREPDAPRLSSPKSSGPAFDGLERLFVRNIWRSWRTWGVTGGILPRDHVYRERVPGTGREEGAPFVPTRRTARLPEKPVRGGAEYRVSSRGRAMREVNSDTLAWIAGPREAFTAKDHHFYAGEEVEKQVVIINDSERAQPYRVTWRVTVAGREISSGGKEGRIGVAETVFVPFGFTSPAVAEKTGGAIALEARIGGVAHVDTFSFRVYPRPKKAKERTVIAFDPEGDTTKMLASVGVEVGPWEGEFGVGAPVLVIGRRAFDGGREPPGSVEQFVASGGRAVMFAQDPEWFRKKMGVRVARHVSRRAWPVQTMADNPIVKGLDGDDLRDWRGSGTLVKPRPKDYAEEGPRWGTGGSVTSAAIEKPHHAGLRPVMECGFDLAYSPLMELHFGDGLFLICTLDLEGPDGSQPVADILARRIIDYAATAEIEPRIGRTVYLGGEGGERFLRQIGLVYDTADSVPDRPALLVVGPDASVPDGHLEHFMTRGGSLFFMAREAADLPLGFKAEVKEEFAGSLEPPDWPETRGLSASDTRLCADVKAAVLVSGPGVVASNGLFGRLERGEGRAVLVQMLPASLDAVKEPFLQYSRRHLTRTNVQVLAGLGAEFLGDTRVFRWEKSPFDPIPLAGEWRRRVEKPLPPVEDEGRARAEADNLGESRGWHETGFDDSGWAAVRVSGVQSGTGGAGRKLPGLHGDRAVWFRREVRLPLSWCGRELVLSLGRPLTGEAGGGVTYFNGKRVGAASSGRPKDPTDRATAGATAEGAASDTARIYTLPPEVLRPGRNVLAVRVSDGRGKIGFAGEAQEMTLRVRGRPEGQGLYLQGFRVVGATPGSGY